MTSPSYRLELEQVEATTEAKTEQLNPLQYKQFMEDGYLLQSSEHNSFQFSISDTIINLKNLSTERSQTHSILTTVTSSGVFGYQILAMPLKGLETTNEDQITPTQCDGKEKTCTFLSANEWKSDTAYGWGYTISGPDSPIDFINETYFRPFKTGQSIVISTNSIANSQKATEMTIKAIIPPESPEGNYSSVIKLIALPKL